MFADWLAAVARANPVIYILEGQRALILEGWDGAALLKGFAAIIGIAMFTFTLTMMALRGRVG